VKFNSLTKCLALNFQILLYFLQLNIRTRKSTYMSKFFLSNFCLNFLFLYSQQCDSWTLPFKRLITTSCFPIETKIVPTKKPRTLHQNPPSSWSTNNPIQYVSFQFNNANTNLYKCNSINIDTSKTSHCQYHLRA
jgi:hypothetical protein